MSDHLKENYYVTERNFEPLLLKHFCSSNNNFVMDSLFYARVYFPVPHRFKIVLPESEKKALKILFLIVFTLNSEEYKSWRQERGINHFEVANTNGFTNPKNPWGEWYPVALAENFDITHSSFNNTENYLYAVDDENGIESFLDELYPDDTVVINNPLSINSCEEFPPIKTTRQSWAEVESDSDSDEESECTSLQNTPTGGGKAAGSCYKSAVKNRSVTPMSADTDTNTQTTVELFNAKKDTGILSQLISMTTKEIATINLKMVDLPKEEQQTLCSNLQKIQSGLFIASTEY